jgi:hypothetical protein
MTFAQFVGDSTTGIIGVINTIVVPFIGALVFVVFIWGVFNYFFFSGAHEVNRAEGRQFVLWGILGIVLFFSVWGFLNIVLSTLGIKSSG